jgi:hypothetical protein
MMTRLGPWIASFLCLAVAAPAARAGVIVVDPAGGPGATLLQSALAASQPGDILLLKAGDYTAPGAPTFSVAGGRTLVADTGAVPTLGGLVIEGATTAPTVLRDLVIAPPPGASGSSFLVLSAGPAWIEGCSAHGVAKEEGIFGTSGLAIQSCPLAWVVRGDFLGGPGFDAHTGPGGELVLASAGGHGLVGFDVDLFVLHDTVATGGAGANGQPDTLSKGWGGEGIQIGFGTQASILGGTFRGGDEGMDAATTSASGPGGSIAFGKLQVRGARFLPGAFFGSGGAALPLKISLGGELTTLTAAARTLELSSPVREQQAATVTVHGEPGDLVSLIVAPDFAGMLAPAKQGVLAFAPGITMTLPLGAITDSSGAFTSGLRFGRLPPGVDGMMFYAQLLVASQGQALLGTVSSTLWLSATL